MSWYALFLLLHIVAAIVWLGSGLLLQVLAHRAERAGDAEGLRRIADDSAQLSAVLFIPASLAVLIFGGLMVLDGPWGFGHLWVALGLAGYAATFLAGVLVMKPGSERIAAILARDGMSAEAVREIRKLLAKGRVDAIVLYLVVAIMALKPTGDDVAVLAAMAAMVVAGLLYTARRVKAIDAGAVRMGVDAARPVPVS